MNNTDILEEKIKIIESLCTDDCINKETVIKPLKYAISTLIAENKELKEMLKHRIEYTNILEKDLFENASNYVIPKSKVKEKIEELQEGCKNCNFRGSICKDFKAFNQCTFQITIKNLQELLED